MPQFGNVPGNDMQGMAVKARGQQYTQDKLQEWQNQNAQLASQPVAQDPQIMAGLRNSDFEARHAAHQSTMMNPGWGGFFESLREKGSGIGPNKKLSTGPGLSSSDDSDPLSGLRAAGRPQGY